MSEPLLVFTSHGIYCPKGDFYIDPWGGPVTNAMITHAHSDHARPNHQNYVAHRDSLPVLKQRLGNIRVRAVEYNEPLIKNGVKISFHPAGHIIGSSQIRVEHQGEIWCVSGDYKTDPDPIAVDFEPVPCHTFITECTFGLPVYQWPDEQLVIKEMEEWWRDNQRKGKVSLISAYALGKAQRLLALLNPSIGKIYCHGAVDTINKIHLELGLLEDTFPYLTSDLTKNELAGSLVVAPPSAIDSTWSRKLGQLSVGVASGWMMLRGTKRRRNVDRGFVFSDHADWNGLNQAVNATSAENVICTHGYTQAFSGWLTEKGLNAISDETLSANGSNSTEDL